MRREFQLPESDTEYLDSLGLNWETIRESGANWLIIANYSIPDGYNVKNAKIALRIDGGYPVAQIDMAYFLPPLYRLDGKVINNLSNFPIDNEVWQQWSRHRTGGNPWRPGEDDVSTHLLLFDFLLKNEFTRA